MDLFDPQKHFSTVVPRMAMRNVGLLKAVLSVASCHMSKRSHTTHGRQVDNPLGLEGGPNELSQKMRATQYYFETLSYLSQAMAYPGFIHSVEILVIASLISTYEMFHGSNRDWERHLKGAFWIQRGQDNDGETTGVGQAVWWNWLRQDAWAAFRDGRETPTEWEPTKPLQLLSGDELANRIIWLLSRCICFSAKQKSDTASMEDRLKEGYSLLQQLQDWFECIPESFAPLLCNQGLEGYFPPIWINPPAYAAAMQYYYFARIVVLMSMPTIGGYDTHHARQSMLDDAVMGICGLVQPPYMHDEAYATISCQCLYVGK